MGARGPKRKPSALKLLECPIDHPHTSICFADRRPINHKEPKPPAGMPLPPAHLSARAKKQWMKIVPQLAGIGLATGIDEMSLEILFDTWDQMLTLRAYLRKNGYWYTIDTEDGAKKKAAYRTQHPEVAAWRNCVEIVRKQLSEFGMTPSARSRIEVELRLPTHGEEKATNKEVDQDRFFRTSNYSPSPPAPVSRA